MLHFSCKQDATFRVPITPKACISSCSKGTAYHQCEALYIIKPQGKCTLTRDEIQGRRAALDDMHRTSCDDDMPSLSAWIKNSTSQNLSNFFGLPERIRTFDLQSRSLTRYPAVPRVEKDCLRRKIRTFATAVA